MMNMKRSILFLLNGICMKYINSTNTNGIASSFTQTDISSGSCRLQGINKESKQIKYYASISGINNTPKISCGRCIKVQCDSTTSKNNVCDKDKSIIAYIIDYCSSCESNTIRISPDSITSLLPNGVSTLSGTGTIPIKWDFIQCPNDYVDGNIKICLMNGASESWIPLQINNFKKYTNNLIVNNKNSSMNPNEFYFTTNILSNSGTLNPNWYSNIQIELTSVDGEKKTDTISFPSTSASCTNTKIQFSASASTSEAENSSSSGINTGLVIPLVVSAIALSLIIVASALYYKRRRIAITKSNKNNDDSNSMKEPYYNQDNNRFTSASATPKTVFDQEATPVNNTKTMGPFQQFKTMFTKNPYNTQIDKEEPQISSDLNNKRKPSTESVDIDSNDSPHLNHVVDTKNDNMNHGMNRIQDNVVNTIPTQNENYAYNNSNKNIIKMNSRNEINSNDHSNTMSSRPVRMDAPLAPNYSNRMVSSSEYTVTSPQGNITSPQGDVKPSNLMIQTDAPPISGNNSNNPDHTFYNNNNISPSDAFENTPSPALLGPPSSIGNNMLATIENQNNTISNKTIENKNSVTVDAPYSRETLNILDYPYRKKITRGSMSNMEIR